MENEQYTYRDRLKSLRAKRTRPDAEALELVCYTFNRIKNLVQEGFNEGRIGPGYRYDIDTACGQGINLVLEKFFEPTPNKIKTELAEVEQLFPEG